MTVNIFNNKNIYSCGFVWMQLWDDYEQEVLTISQLLRRMSQVQTPN